MIGEIIVFLAIFVDMTSYIYWCYKGIGYLGYKTESLMFRAILLGSVRYLVGAIGILFLLLILKSQLFIEGIIGMLTLSLPLKSGVVLFLAYFLVRYLEWGLVYILIRLSFKKNLVYPEKQSILRVNTWLIGGILISYVTDIPWFAFVKFMGLHF